MAPRARAVPVEHPAPRPTPGRAPWTGPAANPPCRAGVARSRSAPGRSPAVWCRGAATGRRRGARGSRAAASAKRTRRSTRRRRTRCTPRLPPSCAPVRPASGSSSARSCGSSYHPAERGDRDPQEHESAAALGPRGLRRRSPERIAIGPHRTTYASALRVSWPPAGHSRRTSKRCDRHTARRYRAAPTPCRRSPQCLVGRRMATRNLQAPRTLRAVWLTAPPRPAAGRPGCPGRARGSTGPGTRPPGRGRCTGPTRCPAARARRAAPASRPRAGPPPSRPPG